MGGSSRGGSAGRSVCLAARISRPAFARDGLARAESSAGGAFSTELGAAPVSWVGLTSGRQLSRAEVLRHGPTEPAPLKPRAGGASAESAAEAEADRCADAAAESDAERRRDTSGLDSGADAGAVGRADAAEPRGDPRWQSDAERDCRADAAAESDTGRRLLTPWTPAPSRGLLCGSDARRTAPRCPADSGADAEAACRAESDTGPRRYPSGLHVSAEPARSLRNPGAAERRPGASGDSDADAEVARSADAAAESDAAGRRRPNLSGLRGPEPNWPAPVESTIAERGWGVSGDSGAVVGCVPSAGFGGSLAALRPRAGVSVVSGVGWAAGKPTVGGSGVVAAVGGWGASGGGRLPVGAGVRGEAGALPAGGSERGGIAREPSKSGPRRRRCRGSSRRAASNAAPQILIPGAPGPRTSRDLRTALTL